MKKLSIAMFIFVFTLLSTDCFSGPVFISRPVSFSRPPTIYRPQTISRPLTINRAAPVRQATPTSRSLRAVTVPVNGHIPWWLLWQASNNKKDESAKSDDSCFIGCLY